MYSPYYLLKQRIIALRKAGKTYREIRKTLGKPIPKSTLSLWCQNIELPAWYRAKVREINSKNIVHAQKIAWINNRKKRKLLLESLRVEALRVIKHLDKENLKIILAALYLGEGAKWKSHSGLMLGSSDAGIVTLYLRLLNECYGVKLQEIKCRVSYRADQDIEKLQEYWSEITKIPVKNFYKTKPDPRTLGKRTLRKEYKGVCVLTCRGANIQLELEQITDLLIKRLGPVAQLARATGWQSVG